MMLGELATSTTWAFGLILSEPDLVAQAINAARQYAAWGSIQSLALNPDASPSQLDDIDEIVDISDGEWGVIKPLYSMYVERQNALGLEASRMQGVEVYGRTVAEVEMDIRMYESDVLPRMAFSQAPEQI
jgi:hypothetical protein